MPLCPVLCGVLLQLRSCVLLCAAVCCRVTPPSPHMPLRLSDRQQHTTHTTPPLPPTDTAAALDNQMAVTGVVSLLEQGEQQGVRACRV